MYKWLYTAEDSIQTILTYWLAAEIYSYSLKCNIFVNLKITEKYLQNF